MRITNLKATAIKGQTFEHALAPVTLFVGDNAQGKSARMNALWLALVGYMIDLGKTNAATFQLSSGPKMEVEVCSEYGNFGRSWSLDGKTVSNREYGPIPATPPVLLDPTVYLNLTERERVKYIFGALDLEKSEWTGEAIVAALQQNKIEVDESRERAREIYFHRVEEISQSDFIRHEAGTSVQEWLEAVIVETKADISETTAAKERMEKLQQGMVELKVGEAASANVGPDLDAARARLAALLQKQGWLAAEQASYWEWQLQVKRYREELEKSPDFSQQLAEAVAAQREIEKREPKPVKAVYSKSDLALAEKELQKWQAQVLHVTQVIEDLKTERKEVLAKERCPCCDSKAKGWRDSYKKKMTGKLLDAESSLGTANHEFENASMNLKAVKINVTESTEYQAAKTLWESDMKEVAWRQKAAAASAKDRETWKKLLTDLEANPKRSPEADLAQVNSDIEATKATIVSLEGKQNQAVAAMREKQRVEEAKAALADSKAKLVALKAILKKLQELQGKMVEWAFGSILKVANQVLAMDGAKPLLKTELAYKDGELGRFEQGLWVSHKTFSGMEKKLCYVALSAALAKDAPIKIILMDELGVMARERRWEFVAQMLKMVQAGVIDQFVGCDADPLAWDNETGEGMPDGVKVIEIK